jgi:hypothetical protein
MKYATEMDSAAMIFIPSFITASGIQKLTEGDVHRHDENHITLL